MLGIGDKVMNNKNDVILEFGGKADAEEIIIRMIHHKKQVPNNSGEYIVERNKTYSGRTRIQRLPGVDAAQAMNSKTRGGAHAEALKYEMASRIPQGRPMSWTAQDETRGGEASSHRVHSSYEGHFLFLRAMENYGRILRRVVG